ncbi:VOC family protein [Methanogenium organophilum]|uniref:Zinc ribbon domain-containing protein n=1 Tax=Methanogenium organophilum TaxID=2199 RepID=A0A9X9T6L0_METOG|nr:VOC family protein [Methanogenium organophilum]WAI00159.1 zinc ribbon domain-containing protein [Methanogenium organophilum]
MGILSPLLAARNMKKTIEFYTKSLGFEMGMLFPNVDQPEYADLSKDGMVLMFIPAEEHGINATEKFGTGVILYMNIDGDIDEYYQELKENNVNITEDIKDEPYGVRDFTIEDTDGYHLAFTKVTARQCQSCGMPMNKPEDFGGGNPASPYCVHCTNNDSSLKSFDEVQKGMVNFLMESQNMAQDAAELKAETYLAGMPAWAGKFGEKKIQ